MRRNQQVDCLSRRKSMGRHTRQSMYPSRKGANLSETSIAWILQFGSRSMPPAGEKLDAAAVVNTLVQRHFVFFIPIAFAVSSLLLTIAS